MESLLKLDAAVQRRFQMEEKFIRRMVKEFNELRNQMADAAASNPMQQQYLKPFIDGINAATQRLHDHPFGTDGQLNEAVTQVIQSHPIYQDIPIATPIQEPATSLDDMLKDYQYSRYDSRKIEVKPREPATSLDDMLKDQHSPGYSQYGSRKIEVKPITREPNMIRIAEEERQASKAREKEVIRRAAEANAANERERYQASEKALQKRGGKRTRRKRR
jgi:hypothetical protein